MTMRDPAIVEREANGRRQRPSKTGRHRGLPTSVRFWSRVEKTDTCWLWQGHIMESGYAVFDSGFSPELGRRKWLRVHRFSYEEAKGPIPEGLTIDHLCRVRHCVNPAHLEAVTNWVNIHRGETLARANLAKTHCLRGHEFTHENTYRHPSGGNRACRICLRINDAAYKARQREKKKAVA